MAAAADLESLPAMMPPMTTPTSTTLPSPFLSDVFQGVTQQQERPADDDESPCAAALFPSPSCEDMDSVAAALEIPELVSR